MSKKNKRPPLAAKRDNYVNFAARLGLGADNMSSFGGYAPGHLLTQDYQQLTDMYCQSWIVGKIVTAVPEDMVRAGIDITGSLNTQQVERIERNFVSLQLWDALQNNLTWGRLFGGSGAVILIDGQDLSEPLRLEAITPGSFRGLLVYDRWQLWPDWTRVVTRLGPDYGRPVWYTIADPQAYGTVPADAPIRMNARVHRSRLILSEGIVAPHDRAAVEQGWGLSVIERVFDRLMAFDAASEGAASLVNKAYLRTLKLKDFRKLLAGPDSNIRPVMKQIDLIRKFQSNEGLTVLDADDETQSSTYTFAGLDQVLLSFGQQLSGASDIPLTRLFGQSPAGLNSTGESDMLTYYDGILRQQESKLRNAMQLLLEIESRNLFGVPLPKDVNFEFNSLKQMSNTEKSAVDTADTNSVMAAFSAGLIDEPAALKELADRGKLTGRWNSITPEMIQESQAGPPSPSVGAPTMDARPKFDIMGVTDGGPGSGRHKESSTKKPAGKKRRGIKLGAQESAVLSSAINDQFKAKFQNRIGEKCGAFTSNYFYIFENHGFGSYIVLSKMRIVGNEDKIAKFLKGSDAK